MPFAYEREPRLTELSAEILATGSEGKRPWAALSDTLLYPEGGGQPADRGFLGEIAVLDVQRRGAEVRHYLERPASAGPVLVRLDWTRRFDHMQQHTGQHLLTALAADRFGWETLSFHLGAELSTIEIGAPRPERSALDELEEALAAEIRAARPVRARTVTPGEMAALPVRTRGLPEGHEGDVRLVEIAGVDLNTCGGTHVASTAEIELVKILGAEARGGSSVLSFVCGGRARRRFGLVESIAAELRAVLQAPDAELAAAAQSKLDRLKGTERRARELSEELAAARADALAAAPERLVSLELPGRELPELQELARALAVRAPRKGALLTGGAPGSPVFVVAFPEPPPPDAPSLFRAVAEALGGRGGGSGRLYQGRAGSLQGVESARELLRVALPPGLTEVTGREREPFVE